MVEAVGILGENTGWGGLSASQNAMLQAAMAKYGGPQMPDIKESKASEQIKPVQAMSDTAQNAREHRGSSTMDGTVMQAIAAAVAVHSSAGNSGNFARVLARELEGAGIDSSKSVIDFYA